METKTVIFYDLVFNEGEWYAEIYQADIKDRKIVQGSMKDIQQTGMFDTQLELEENIEELYPAAQLVSVG